MILFLGPKLNIASISEVCDSHFGIIEHEKLKSYLVAWSAVLLSQTLFGLDQIRTDKHGDANDYTSLQIYKSRK
jgi:hypothetical protein